MLSCDCRRKCLRGSCSCKDAGLKCTDACRYRGCDNINQHDSDESGDENEFIESDNDEEYDGVFFN